MRFFVGPKQFDLLQSVDAQLVRAINFGTFRVIAVPLLTSLKWVHGFIGNWGWSIIVLTIIINLAIFPLRHKSLVSMRRMQALQPQLKAIQDRYSGLKMTDPGRQKMNIRDHGAVQREGRQPGERMHADAADAAGAVRVLLAAVAVDRVAWRRLRMVDQGSVANAIRCTSRRC